MSDSGRDGGFTRPARADRRIEMHSKLITEERGQSMAEFAIVLPVLVVVLFGIIQFGILFNNYVTLTDAVRAGARTAAVSRQDPDPSGEAATMVRTSAANLDQSNLNVSVSSDWQSGDGVLMYLGRYHEPASVLLPYNNARSEVLGTYWVVGFLVAN